MFMGRTILPKAKVPSMAISTHKMSGLGLGTNHSTMIGDISQWLFQTTPLVCVEVGNMPTAIVTDIGIVTTTEVGTALSKE